MKNFKMILSYLTVLSIIFGVIVTPPVIVYAEPLKVSLTAYQDFQSLGDVNAGGWFDQLPSSGNNTTAGWRRQSVTAGTSWFSAGQESETNKFLELHSRSSASNFMNYASHVWQTGKTIGDIAPDDEAFVLLVKARLRLNQSNDGGYLEVQLSKEANNSTFRLFQLASTGSYTSPSTTPGDFSAKYYGSTGTLTTALSTIAANQWTDIIAKIDVPASLGDPRVTYYINGQQFTTDTRSGTRSAFLTVNSARMTLFRPGNATPVDPQKSAYEAIEKIGGVDNFEAYMVTGGAIPFGLAENGFNGGILSIPVSQTSVDLKFNTEVYKNAFTNGKITLQRGSDEAIAVADTDISVSDDQKGIRISNLNLEEDYDYTLNIDPTVSDVFGTTISSGSQSISFSTWKVSVSVWDATKTSEVSALTSDQELTVIGSIAEEDLAEDALMITAYYRGGKLENASLTDTVVSQTGVWTLEDNVVTLGNIDGLTMRVYIWKKGSLSPILKSAFTLPPAEPFYIIDDEALAKYQSLPPG